jgi:hypothetical protein
MHSAKLVDNRTVQVALKRILIFEDVDSARLLRVLIPNPSLPNQAGNPGYLWSDDLS